MANMLYLENAQIIFKNFSGKEGEYNDEGVRSFNAVIADEELAQTLIADGWNVKTLPAKPEYDEEEKLYLPIAVSYKNIPPRIEMIMGNNKVSLSEENVGELDYQRILTSDLYIAPSQYRSRITGENKIKAYLRTAVITVELDPVAQKYANWGK